MIELPSALTKRIPAKAGATLLRWDWHFLKPWRKVTNKVFELTVRWMRGGEEIHEAK